jgi:hypothetical protein
MTSRELDFSVPLLLEQHGDLGAQFAQAGAFFR